MLLPMSHNNCYICIYVAYIKCNKHYGTEVLVVIINERKVLIYPSSK